MTATIARIRRCIRDSQFAVAQDPTILATRPDAKPSGNDDFTIDSFFDSVSVAQVMTNERFAILSDQGRDNEAAESSTPLRIGIDVAIRPVLPKARMRDRTRGVDKAMLIKGLSIDMQTERNSIEASG